MRRVKKVMGSTPGHVYILPVCQWVLLTQNNVHDRWIENSNLSVGVCECLCVALWWSDGVSSVSPCFHSVTAGSPADPPDPECSKKYWKWCCREMFGWNCLVVYITVKGSRTREAVSLYRTFVRIKGDLFYKIHLTRCHNTNVSLTCWSVSQWVRKVQPCICFSFY